MKKLRITGFDISSIIYKIRHWGFYIEYYSTRTIDKERKIEIIFISFTKTSFSVSYNEKLLLILDRINQEEVILEIIPPVSSKWMAIKKKKV